MSCCTQFFSEIINTRYSHEHIVLLLSVYALPNGDETFLMDLGRQTDKLLPYGCFSLSSLNPPKPVLDTGQS